VLLDFYLFKRTVNELRLELAAADRVRVPLRDCCTARGAYLRLGGVRCEEGNCVPRSFLDFRLPSYFFQYTLTVQIT